MGLVDSLGGDGPKARSRSRNHPRMQSLRFGNQVNMEKERNYEVHFKFTPRVIDICSKHAYNDNEHMTIIIRG